MKKSKLEIPWWEKYCLSIEEAAAYSMIGENKLRRMIEEDAENEAGKRVLDFVLYSGSTKRIKRPQFEKWLETACYV